MYPCWNARAVGLNLDARETLEIAARTGFAGVDLLVRDLVESGEDARELRARMDDLGLRGGAWPLPVDWRGADEKFQADLNDLPRYARAAAILGLARTGTWVLPEPRPGCALGPADDPVERTSAFHLDRLGRIARVLDDHGVRLGLEVIGPATARDGRNPPFVFRYRHVEERLAELRWRHLNIGVLVDAFHLFAAGDEGEEGLVWGGDAVIWVHVADAAHAERATLLDHERTLPGEREWSNCRSVLRCLDSRGYDGPVTAEPLGRCQSLVGLSPEETAFRTIAALRSVWPGRTGNG